jgi:molybdopterin molybdotransferase
VFSTGDEVRDPSGDAPEGCIFDSNRFSVIGLLQDMGCRVTDLGILGDDEDTIAAALQQAAADHDVLVTSGGVSAGEEDHVKAAVERDGEIHFWRLSIKPGRPIALGRVRGAAFVGLPGNPVAAMVTFMVLARPLLLRLGGAVDIAAPRYAVKAGFDYKKKTGRREWVRARLEAGADGLVARKFRSGGSGILTSMVFADGLVELNEARGNVREGEAVDFLPFNEVAR